MEMLSITLEKIVTVSEDISKNYYSMYTCKYKDLAGIVKDQKEIKVSYPFGRKELRNKMLNKLGFVMKENIFYNDDALHSRIQQIWVRG